jgi:hypothetical protein
LIDEINHEKLIYGCKGDNSERAQKGQNKAKLGLKGWTIRCHNTWQKALKNFLAERRASCQML